MREGGREGGRGEGRRDVEYKVLALSICPYLEGWLKVAAMLDPLKLSVLAKASTDGWTPSPTTANFGS